MNRPTFKRAQRRAARLKLAITGPSGSGKTTAALRLARGLVGPSGRIALIDTENRSASLYEDLTEFDVLDLEPPFEQQKFREAIEAAVAGGYDALIIDSASHFWEAILDYKDKLDRRGGSGFQNWQEAGKQFKVVLDSILQAPLHVVCCLRAKMEHVIEESGGKKTVRKVGMAPIMRDGVEFEFTTVLDLGMDHHASASKDRTRLFDGRIQQVTEDTGRALAAWLSTAKAEEPPPPPAPPLAPAPAAPAQRGPAISYERPHLVAEIEILWEALGKKGEDVAAARHHLGANPAPENPECPWDDLEVAQGERLLAILQRQEARAKAAAATATQPSTPPAPPPAEQDPAPNAPAAA